jgi:predicted acylesterase/phospholipase RssA
MVIPLLLCWHCYRANAAIDSATGPNLDLPQVIRIAVPFYDDKAATFTEYEKLFLRQLNPTTPHPSFNIIVGTYDQVLYWYQNDMVDLAILPPGAVADLLTTTQIDARSDVHNSMLGELYIGSRALLPPESPVLVRTKEQGQVRFSYKAFCVVLRDDKGIPLITDFDDLIVKSSKHLVKFLFVHPLSVSGRILPEYLLTKNGIKLDPKDIEWTYNHGYSLLRLAESQKDSSKITVAFIWDALQLDSAEQERKHVDPKQLFSFPIPDDHTLIPQEILVSTPKFKREYKLNALESLLGVNAAQTKHEFKKIPDWKNQYKELLDWVNFIKTNQSQEYRNDLSTPLFTLNQIGARLRNYAEMHSSGSGDKYPLRLAVVLSGGGAKCAYQLGVIEAIEAELQKLRNEGANVDIDLVVGTSGGAINALPVAMGMTSSDSGRKNLYDLWQSLDQTKLVRMPYEIVFPLGAWFGLLQAAFFVSLSLLIRNHFEEWWKPAGISMLVFSTIEFIIMIIDWTPWKLLGGFGQGHILRHAWLAFSVNVGVSAFSLFVFGLLLILAGWLLTRRNIKLHLYQRKVVIGLVLGIILLPLIIILIQLSATSIVESEGYENLLIENFSHLTKMDVDSQSLTRRSDKDKLRYLSQVIVTMPLLKRDLVITGSALSTDDQLDRSNNTHDIQSDMYFYFSRSSQQQASQDNTSLDKRFIPLTVSDNRFLLLDAVIGSGSIYPLFPPRTLQCVRRTPEDVCHKVELIDGGFIHNSPIEAAVKLGATHIIVVEASPDELPTKGGGLIPNSIAAFNYLFSQAQSLDSRMYGQREIFVIKPTIAKDTDDPNLDTFDFSDNLIRGAIDKGLNDALNVQTPHFFRVQGQPSL